MSAKQWKIALHLNRKRNNLKLGLISRSEVIDVYQKMIEVAGAQGFEVFGSVESERRNCPSCGYLVMSVSGKCSKCGKVVE